MWINYYFLFHEKRIFLKTIFSLFIVIKGDRIDATPGFYTYDASKIRVGEIPPGLVGMPVEFQGEYIL